MCNRTTCHDITSCGVPEVLFLMLLCFLCQTCLKNIWCFSCCSVWCSANTDRKSGTADTLRHTLEISSRLKVDWQKSSRQNWGSGPPHHSQSDQVLSLTLGANVWPELTLSPDQPEVHQKPEEAERHHIQSCDPESDGSDQQRNLILFRSCFKINPCFLCERRERVKVLSCCLILHLKLKVFQNKGSPQRTD